MKFLFLALVFLSGISVAAASSPGIKEWPPGCIWDATVTDIGTDGTKIRLDAIQGTCMRDPGPCGAEGDVFSVAAETPVKKGDRLRAWVDIDGNGGFKATLNRPACVHEPL